MKNLIHIDAVSNQYIDDPDFKSMLKTVMLGDAVGTEKFYVNIDYVKPGAKSVKYHTHSKQEEFFMILRGNGMLRFDGEDYTVKTGDVFSKPPGKEFAHQFINTGTEILEILDVGSREVGDAAFYPDEEIVLLRGEKKAFHLSDAVEGWSSDPNEE